MIDPEVLPTGVDKPRLLVLRFHALGDCILATGLTRALGGSARVTVMTEERFTPVFAGLPWVERLLTREGFASDRTRSPLRTMSAPMVGDDSTNRFDRVIDLQGTPGSRRLARALGGPTAIVRTRAASRRWIVFWGDRFPRPRVPHAIARYAEAAGLTGAESVIACRPEVRVTAAEEDEARRLAPEVFGSAATEAVAIVTGASRRTKEYPADRFAEVARRIEAAGLITWWIEAPAGGPGRAGPVLRLPLGPLKAVLARARTVVVSDSGPMHLAAALGVPVVGIFGSTVPAFGFAPQGPRARLLQTEDVSCRPCSVHGRNRCWLGHWRCLRDLKPDRVAEEVLAAAGDGDHSLTRPAVNHSAGEGEG